MGKASRNKREKQLTDAKSQAVTTQVLYDHQRPPANAPQFNDASDPTTEILLKGIVDAVMQDDVAAFDLQISMLPFIGCNVFNLNIRSMEGGPAYSIFGFAKLLSAKNICSYLTDFGLTQEYFYQETELE